MAKKKNKKRIQNKIDNKKNNRKKKYNKKTTYKKYNNTKNSLTNKSTNKKTNKSTNNKKIKNNNTNKKRNNNKIDKISNVFSKISKYILICFNFIKKYIIMFIRNIPKYLNKLYVIIENVLIKLFKLLKIFALKISKYFLILINKIINIFKNIHLNNKKKRRKNKKNKAIKIKNQQKSNYVKKVDNKHNDITDVDDKKDLALLRYEDYKNKLYVFFVNRGRVLLFDMKRFRKKMKYGTLKDKILILVMLVLIVIFTAGISVCLYIIVTAPDIDNDRLYRSSSSTLYDINGNAYAKIGTEAREKVTYDELPQVLVDAIVATEDSRFFQHNGVDIARFTKAAIGQLLGHSDAGGGSTLTMQLSKMTATDTEASGIKGIVRKLRDIYLAVFVYEKKYTKEQIIEFYVNIPFLGDGAYGVQQASKNYFGKDVSELNLVESATIAGLFQAPTPYDPYVNPDLTEKRRNVVLNLMCRHGYITEEERDTAQSVPIESELSSTETSTINYSRFVYTVVDEVQKRTGYNPYTTSMDIYTTLKPEQQKVVDDIQDGVTYKYNNDKSENSIAVIDVETGAITAIGTGRNVSGVQRSYNYATNGRNHPGSTAKPIVDYGPAIEYLNWGTGQTIIDDTYGYTVGGSIKNWDDKYNGIMTIKTALAKSRNIPALLTFQQTTNEQKLTFSKNLGWTLEDDGAGNILETCSIGGFDGVTAVESAAAYAAFARGGTYIEPYTFTKVVYTDTNEEYVVQPNKVQAMGEDTAFLINVILRYAIQSGDVSVGGSVSGTEIASKTGTSTVDEATIKALHITKSVDGDVWQVAYSPKTVISLWYGYPHISSEYYLSSSEGSKARYNITKQLVQGIIQKNEGKFEQPASVTEVTIELETDPVELASEYTPDSLKSKEYYKTSAIPSSTSERFSKLSKPSDLQVSTNGGTTTLSWKGISTPSAIDPSYLSNYFKTSSIYKAWADKYYQRRINYNNSYIGNIGYEVYVTDSSGNTTNLGWTQNTSFTYNGYVSGNVTFTVKSAYSIFKANMSDGISASATVTSSNSSTENTTKSQTSDGNLEIVFNGSNCLTKDDYKADNNTWKSKITVMYNGAKIQSDSYNLNVITDTDGMPEGQVKLIVSYNNSSKNITLDKCS